MQGCRKNIIESKQFLKQFRSIVFLELLQFEK